MSQQIETKTEEIQKQGSTKVDPMTTVVSDLLKTKDTLLVEKSTKIAELEKKLTELEKTKNANPVDSGIEEESKPKVTDEHDVGDKADAKNKLAPKPSESQASIVTPAVKEPGKDNSGISMENKYYSEKMKDDSMENKYDSEKMKYDSEKMKDEKSEEKKEEVKKADLSKVDSMYKKVKTVRPLLKSRTDNNGVPTAYQMLKAVEGGFGGSVKDADQALTIMYDKMNKGEFGDGNPSGGVFY